MIDGRHCNLCYLDMVAGGSQCSDYYPGGSLLPDSDNDGLWMSTQLVTVVQQVHNPVPDTGVQILRNRIPGYPFSATR